MKKLIKNEIDEVFVPIKNKENAKPQGGYIWKYSL